MSAALIPAGEFQMGDVFNEGDSNERPVHTVYLDAFYMDAHEVTVGQYKQFVEATGHRAPDWNRVAAYAPTDEHPIIFVSWNDAVAYCEWAGKRLPTEAEWEYAARGGLDGKRYPWGDEAPDRSRANFNGMEGGTTPVGKYAANGYGLYDMAGNVWEWCSDWYGSGYYASRVLRGGSWNYSPFYLRVANRNSNVPANTHGFFGFRCAQDASNGAK